MNVLNVCDSAEWDISAYQALQLAERLCKTGHGAAVLCPKNSRLAAECAKLKVRTLPLTVTARFGLFDPAGWDIVHFYNPSDLPQLLLKKVSSKARIFVSQYRLGSSRAFLKLAEAAPYVSMYLGACNSVQEDFVAAGIDPARTFMLPPCLRIGRWESAMLIKPAMFQKKPYRVGTVSMDPTFRDQELFLLAAKEVLETMPDTAFMLVGLKHDRIRDYARTLGISHKVDILSDRNDMPEVMAMMHIYAKTSVRDGLSMSLIEAQASGVACVLPRLRGISDFTVNGKNGVIVEPGDPLACARAVIRLISEPQTCHAMSKLAFEYVNDNMSLPVVGNILTRLYEDSLAGGG